MREKENTRDTGNKCKTLNCAITDLIHEFPSAEVELKQLKCQLMTEEVRIQK